MDNWNSGTRDETDLTLARIAALLSVIIVGLPAWYLLLRADNLRIYLPEMLVYVGLSLLFLWCSMIGATRLLGWLSLLGNILVPIGIVLLGIWKGPALAAHGLVLLVFCLLAWLPVGILQESLGFIFRRAESILDSRKAPPGPPPASNASLIIAMIIGGLIFIGGGASQPHRLLTAGFAVAFFLLAFALLSLVKLLHKAGISQQQPIIISADFARRWVLAMLGVLLIGAAIAMLLPQQPYRHLRNALHRAQQQREQREASPGQQPSTEHTGRQAPAPGADNSVHRTSPSSSPSARRPAPNTPGSPQVSEHTSAPGKDGGRPKPQQNTGETSDKPSSNTGVKQGTPSPSASGKPAASDAGQQTSDKSGKEQAGDGKPGQEKDPSATSSTQKQPPGRQGEGSSTSGQPSSGSHGQGDSGAGKPTVEVVRPWEGLADVPREEQWRQISERLRYSWWDALLRMATLGEGRAVSAPHGTVNGHGQPVEGMQVRVREVTPDLVNERREQLRQALREQPLRWLKLLAILALYVATLAAIIAFFVRRRRRTRPPSREEEVKQIMAELHPFADPFATLQDPQPAELAAAVYASFIAYLWLRDLEKQPEQTEFDFAQRVVQYAPPPLHAEAVWTITRLCTRLQYADRPLSDAEYNDLRDALHQVKRDTLAFLPEKMRVTRQQEYLRHLAERIYAERHAQLDPLSASIE